MTQHTKTPWESHNGEITTRQENGRSYRRIAAVQDYGLGSLPEVDEANAEFIVRACNSHGDLLAALKQLRSINPMSDYNELRDARTVADEAIAKAEGR